MQFNIQENCKFDVLYSLTLLGYIQNRTTQAFLLQLRKLQDFSRSRLHASIPIYLILDDSLKLADPIGDTHTLNVHEQHVLSGATPRKKSLQRH